MISSPTQTQQQHHASSSNSAEEEDDSNCGYGGGGGTASPAHKIISTSQSFNFDAKPSSSSDRPLLLSHHSSSMPDFSTSATSLIREVDADILEYGVEEKQHADLADFDDNGYRVEKRESIVRSESNISLSGSEFQLDDNNNVDDVGDNNIIANIIESYQVEEGSKPSTIIQDESTAFETQNQNLAPPPLPLYSISSSTDNGDNSCNNNIMPAIAENKSCHIPHPEENYNNNKTEQLTCESSPTETETETDADTNDWSCLDTISPCSPSSYPTSKQLQVDQEIHHDITYHDIATTAADGETDQGQSSNEQHLRKHHHRSISFDRRINESAQFAEAVGELVEPNILFLKKIIEEDSSSDFDDDEIDEEGVGLGDDVNIDVGEVLYDDDEENDRVDYQEDVGIPLSPIEAESEKQQPPQSTPEDITEAVRDIAKDMSTLQVGESSGSNINQVLCTQLSATFEADSAPTTPSPSPCKAPRGTVTSFHPPCYVDWKFTRQYSSGSNLIANNARSSGPNDNDKPMNGSSVPNSPQEQQQSDFVYRGIRSKYLEVTKRGIARGNYAQLHRKAWLEVSDKHHRYGKNLRMYYKHWESMGHPYHMFFDWLDSKKEAAGQDLPNLPEIPRSLLDSDTVLYITNPEVSARYALYIIANPTDGSALIRDLEGQPISTGKEGWIFILRDHVMYGSQKVTAPNNNASPAAGGGVSPSTTTKSRQRFHHSSFFGGKAVASAGIFLTDEHGRMTQLYPHSGHYRPGEAHMQRALFFFQQLGVDLSTFLVDMQQIFKVSRKFAPGQKAPTASSDKEKNEMKDKENVAGTDDSGKQLKAKKSKKVDCLHLMCGFEVACFLAHKSRMIEKGVFHQIHQIRRVPKPRLVGLVLDYVNN